LQVCNSFMRGVIAWWAAIWLLALTGCATLPDYKSLSKIDPPQQLPQINGPKGPLSPAHSEAVLNRLQKTGKSTLLERHLAFMEALNSNPLVVGNSVQLLIDGPATYRAMFEAIAAAHDNINLETYILEDDEVGQEFADALIRKQREGVQVNIMYDSVGSIETSAAYFDRLKREGVNVCEYNPVNPLKGNILALNNRDHRKMLVVDGNTGFAGGINISRVYSSNIFKRHKTEKTEERWRDTHVEVKGPAAKELQQLFMANWHKERCAALAQRNYFPVLKKQGNMIVRTIGSSPDTSTLNLIYIELLSAISHAERSIDITMAYFIPDPQFINALKQAVKRGVQVTLLLPGYSDYRITFYAGRSYYDELLSAGIKIYERHDALLHAKTAVIDGIWSTVGSSNMDLRSFLHNDEVNVVVLGNEFASEMQAMFNNDLAASTYIDINAWRHRGAAEHMKEALSRIWAYWL
jgi:cardiolipin synthase